MTRHFIRLAYNGAPYHGWQRQPHDISVQQVLEEALAMVFRRPCPVTGAGRTDTGVNATCMYAHVDLDTRLDDDRATVRALNAILGRDIAVYAVTPVAPDAHARFDATSRTYHYHVHTVKSPFRHTHSLQVRPDTDFGAMNAAARMLLDIDDFTSFAKLHTDVKTNICRVTRALWEEPFPGVHVFAIEADRFLRNMVRAVVGTLVDVGRGKLDTDGFQRIIDTRDRCAAGTSMPPEALYLWDVRYPQEIFIP